MHCMKQNEEGDNACLKWWKNAEKTAGSFDFSQTAYYNRDAKEGLGRDLQPEGMREPKGQREKSINSQVKVPGTDASLESGNTPKKQGSFRMQTAESFR